MAKTKINPKNVATEKSDTVKKPKGNAFISGVFTKKTFYNKRVVVQIKSNLVLKIILCNA